MIKHNKTFFLDFQALERMNKNNLSDTRISESIDRHKSWLNKVKKAGENGHARIDERDAHKLAGLLECAVDDIGYGQVRDAMDFDYKAASENYLSKLLNENPAFVVELLRFAVEAEPERRECMLAALQLLQKESSVGNADTWFRYLLTISFGKILLHLIEAPRESQLRMEYDRAKGSSKSFEEKTSAMRYVISPKVTHFFERYGVEDWFDSGEALNATKNTTIDYLAFFLVMCFECPSSSQAKFVDLYKKGIWCFSI